MKILNILLGFLIITSVHAEENKFPKEVQAFTNDRDGCDHFRGEYAEGNSPEAIERRAFISDSVEILCSGSDRRLAALKKRYKNNSAVIKHLNQYQKQINAPCYPAKEPK